MTKATIVFLIDIQNGFAKSDLTPEQGGSLYVPDGEKVVEPTANLLARLSNTTVVLSQDFHPKNHISFASNNNVEPMAVVNLKQDPQTHTYVAIDHEEPCSIAQTMWPDHCVQGTPSTLFVEPILSELPISLAGKLLLHSKFGAAHVLFGEDDRDNEFYVVRKGMRPDLDSYGIATENDGVSKTFASEVFFAIATTLKSQNVTEANIYIGGLATNFCVEFSHKDIYTDLIPELNDQGIRASVHFLTDISAGIPIETPDGSWPDLANAQKRMAAFGTKMATTGDVLRDSLSASKLGRNLHAPQP